MQGGARRPRPADELTVVCDAIERLLKLDLRLRPYMQEQIQLQKQRLFDQQLDEALDRVYGPEKKAQV